MGSVLPRLVPNTASGFAVYLLLKTPAFVKQIIVETTY